MHRENGGSTLGESKYQNHRVRMDLLFKDNYFLENPQFVQLLELKENEFIAAGIGPYAMKN